MVREFVVLEKELVWVKKCVVLLWLLPWCVGKGGGGDFCLFFFFFLVRISFLFFLKKRNTSPNRKKDLTLQSFPARFTP